MAFSAIQCFFCLDCGGLTPLFSSGLSHNATKSTTKKILSASSVLDTRHFLSHGSGVSFHFLFMEDFNAEAAEAKEVLFSAFLFWFSLCPLR
jgi:hypothetical protein